MEAREHYYHFNKEENAVALKLFEEAITLDPDYAFAYSGLAWAHAANVWLGVTKIQKNHWYWPSSWGEGTCIGSFISGCPC